MPKHNSGWCTIYHLSAPHGNSINNYINPDDYTLSYCSVDDAYAILNLLGTGALMSKIDLKNAFRLIPIHPNDWNLLGICWRNKFYIDTCLPFGLCSVPFIFNQLSVAIYWICVLPHVCAMGTAAYILYAVYYHMFVPWALPLILYAVYCCMFVPWALLLILYAVYCCMFVSWVLLFILYAVYCHILCHGYCLLYCMIRAATCLCHGW